MKILYVCTTYQRAMLFRDSMNALEERGHEVLAFNAVAHGTKVDPKYASIMDEKVVHRECFNKYDRFFFHLKQKKIQNSLESNINVRDFDLIHSHMLFNGGWATYKLHRKYGVPYVVSIRNTDLNYFLKVPFFKKIARTIVDNASGVLFLSEAYKESFLDRCYPGKKRESVLAKCDVIPNGLEQFWLENVAEPKQSIHSPLELLFVGKIDKNKNIETTLRVLDKLNDDGVDTHLTVIGQVLDSDVKALLEGSQDTTTIDYLTKEELIGYYRSSDIFIMPSFKETFGRVYAEAMTQGVPVIYTRGQGFDGIFPEGTVGFRVKADDVDEIVDAVKKIMGNYAAVSQNCVEKCRIFNWKDISERLERLYLNAAKADA